MVTAVVENPATTAIHQNYLDDLKPAIIAALEESGGSLFVRVNGPAIPHRTLCGTRLVSDGDGRIHEVEQDRVEKDQFGMSMVELIVGYLRVLAHNEEHPDDQKKPEQVLHNDGVTRTNKIDVFTDKTLVNTIKQQVIAGSMAGAANQPSFTTTGKKAGAPVPHVTVSGGQMSTQTIK